MPKTSFNEIECLVSIVVHLDRLLHLNCKCSFIWLSSLKTKANFIKRVCSWDSPNYLHWRYAEQLGDSLHKRHKAFVQDQSCETIVEVNLPYIHAQFQLLDGVTREFSPLCGSYVKNGFGYGWRKYVFSYIFATREICWNGTLLKH